LINSGYGLVGILNPSCTKPCWLVIIIIQNRRSQKNSKLKIQKKMKYLILCLFFIHSNSFSQNFNVDIEKEILSLNNNEKIKEYWNKIHKDDQSVRGTVFEGQNEVDVENFKKIILMIKHHGYPNGFTITDGDKNLIGYKNFTPNIVTVHNTNPYLKEFIFPILKKAYDENIANEFWFIHNLRGMTRARYGRDFYDKKVENIPLFYGKLNPFVKKEINYDINIVDSLDQKYKNEIEQILNLNKVFSKKKKGITHNIYKMNSNNYYWQKVYNDNTFNMPQEIYYNEKNNSLYYKLLEEEITERIIIKNKKKILNK